MLSRYRAFGLELTSEIAIPGALPGTEACTPQMRIFRGDADAGTVVRRFGPYILGSGGLLFQRADVASFLISLDGVEIRVQSSASAAMVDVAAFLIATALPAALWLRGDLLLHAAVFVPVGASGAIAVTGRSGAGKSTLLNSLVAQGNSVVAEDVACVRRHADHHVVSGLPRNLWLRSPGDALHAERECVEVPLEQCLADARLHAIVVLVESEPGSVPHLTRLTGADAMEAVIAHRHRPSVPSLMKLHGRLLLEIASLIKNVQVYVWNSAKSQLPELSAALRGLADSLAGNLPGG